MKINLSQPLARNSAANRADVYDIKRALNQAGYYQPDVQAGITDIPDKALFEAIKDFQKNHALPASGTIKPNDETLQKINQAADHPPTEKYIWRTVGDDKVRPAHAALNGTVRSWADKPTPGSDVKCRCWAEFFEPMEPGLKPVTWKNCCCP